MSGDAAEDAVLTAEEAAKVAKVAAQTIRKLCETGEIPARDFGTGKRRVWRIDAGEFAAWLKGGKTCGK